MSSFGTEGMIQIQLWQEETLVLQQQHRTRRLCLLLKCLFPSRIPLHSPSNSIPRAQRLLLTKAVESFPSPDVPPTKGFR